MRTIILTVLAICTVPIARAQLVLPWSGTDPTATLSSFQIIKTGTSGRANTLYITNAANASDALLVNTVGTGKAGFFQINNASSSNTAVRGDSNGTGTSVAGIMTGMGRAGTFRNTNLSNGNYALYVAKSGLGSTLRVESGGGYAVDAVGEINVNSGGRGLLVTAGTGIQAFGASLGAEGHSSGNSGIGLWGIATGTSSLAVKGDAQATTSVNYGGFFTSASDAGTGLIGYCTNPSGITYGLKGNVVSPNGWAVYAVGKSGGTGTKSFQVDHPLDPENKYLNHYSTEAPEPINFYSGNIVTDARGFATVVLPAYFESINRDVRYQLTVIDIGDDFVLAKIISEVSDNQFVLRTSKPQVKVSWRVEGIRNDRWVQRYGYGAEEDKRGRDRGKYAQPELYGQPAEKGIHYPALSQPVPPKVARR